MHKILEYIKLLPRAVANADKVIEGYINDAKLENKELSENEEKEIIRRRIICEGCPFNSENAIKEKNYKELSGEDYTTDRDDKHCVFCGCGLKKKSASLSSNCGIEYWNKEHKDKQIELKWTKYETTK